MKGCYGTYSNLFSIIKRFLVEKIFPPNERNNFSPSPQKQGKNLSLTEDPLFIYDDACLDAVHGVLRAVDLLGDLPDDVDVTVLEEFGEVEQYGEEDHHGEARVGFLLS